MMRIGVVGRIESGEEQGRYVFVKDDSDNTGGFLILTAEDPDLSIEGSDSWVQSREDLDRFAEESNWVVNWTDKDEQSSR